MNIMLLGNGFDLHHKFLTNYIDFLHIVNFLLKHEEDCFTTVGEVLKNKELQDENDYIRDSYSLHHNVYDKILLTPEFHHKIVGWAKSNLWFNYFLGSISRDVGWIDFEKEIGVVLQAFDAFLGAKQKFNIRDGKFRFNLAEHPERHRDRFIIQQFGFFFEREKNPLNGAPGTNIQLVDKKYILERPQKSRCWILHEDGIIDVLFESLRHLAKMLQLYLKNFVDEPASLIEKQNIRHRCASYPMPNHVFTFNYSNTFELLYGNASVEHVHGNVDKDIVLGINPDERDELMQLDTTFIQFKKYFQRVFFKTDDSYLNKIQALNQTRKYDNGYSLYVIGHSLDITDKDIIIDLFDLSNRIFILYHSSNAVKTYIKNLVSIFGKRGFDDLRRNKNLTFLKQAEMDWENE